MNENKKRKLDSVNLKEEFLIFYQKLRIFYHQPQLTYGFIKDIFTL